VLRNVYPTKSVAKKSFIYKGFREILILKGRGLGIDDKEKIA